MLTEENITMTILDYLEGQGWEILCFDYPQSGTGIYFKDDNAIDEKNKNSINPDIIAYKDNVSLYFENKSYYYKPDFDLIKNLKKYNPYRNSIDKKLRRTKESIFYYGVGLPMTKEIENRVKKGLLEQNLDFAVLVSETKEVHIFK